jgi:hypothetical protein
MIRSFNRWFIAIAAVTAVAITTACTIQPITPPDTSTLPDSVAAIDCGAGFVDASASNRTLILQTLAAMEPIPAGGEIQIPWQPEEWDALVAQVVAAGEEFLDGCIDETQPIAAQPGVLEQLAAAARIVPELEVVIPGEGDFLPFTLAVAPTFTPTVQLMDLTGDGQDELLLHTQVGYFGNQFFQTGVTGGLSIAYTQGESGWEGHVVWPVPVFVNAPNVVEFSSLSEERFAPEAHWSATDALVYFPGPESELHRAPGGQPLLLLSHRLPGPVNDSYELAVLSWAEDAPELLLRVSLDEWCAMTQWEVRAGGAVYIPALPDTFPHGCIGPQPARTFVYAEGQYIEQFEAE